MNEIDKDIEQLDKYLQDVRNYIRQFLTDNGREPREFYNAIQYPVGLVDEQMVPGDSQSGKMLRPRLCILSCMAAGGEVRKAIPAAAAIEILHNFTLVHDDIEDHSPSRRHRPSLWNLIGVPLALNAGDGMFVISHMVLQSMLELGVPAQTVLAAIDKFDQAALSVCEGQHMDLMFEAREEVSLQEYLAMISRKTGALMGLSCYLGALVAGKDECVLEQYRHFGENLGLAYQIRDDIAGIWESSESTGKRELEDIFRKKKSYPIVKAMEVLEGNEAERLRQIYKNESITDEEALWVKETLKNRGIMQEGIEKVHEYLSRAVAALQQAGASGVAMQRLQVFVESLSI